MQTYFISDGARVKIGKSTNPSARLKQLQVGSATKLQLLITIQGDYEAVYHDMFHDRRISGEWFIWDDAATDLVFFIITGRRSETHDSLLGLVPMP